mmetsp:Transcript_25791/g.54439  ORF Transcript_25791/g.54439 Transcript_25791/m.54439 type:complete len:247 (+) Transcript_25791:966-1706(+)
MITLLFDLDSPDCTYLDRVSEGCAGAVARPYTRLRRGAFRLRVGVLDDDPLCQAVGSAQGRRAAVLAHLRGPPHRVFVIGQVAPLEDDSRTAIAAHVAAGCRVEGQATPNGRVHRISLASCKEPRDQAQVDPCADEELELVTYAVAHCELREVGRAKGCRASCVAHVVRTLHVEDEAEAIGDDGNHVRATLTFRRFVDESHVPVGLVQAHGAASVMRVTVGNLLGNAQLEQVVGTALQHKPLHGIH